MPDPFLRSTSFLQERRAAPPPSLQIEKQEVAELAGWPATLSFLQKLSQSQDTAAQFRATFKREMVDLHLHKVNSLDIIGVPVDSLFLPQTESTGTPVMSEAEDASAMQVMGAGYGRSSFASGLL